MIKMAQAIFEKAKITNIEMKSHALLEVAPGIHSPVCPYLVEFSVCVPPALHMGMTYDFHIAHCEICCHICEYIDKKVF